MSTGIEPLPKVPDEIRNAVNKGTLAVFIGAGVSRLVGCDGWDTLCPDMDKFEKRDMKDGLRVVNARLLCLATARLLC